ncbi:hypothetical protein B9Z55_004107 [Caenorhabditis nigoni]|nr:hypothetical protein B9Z55_004107 [Caenorhabditis nigoni]
MMVEEPNVIQRKSQNDYFNMPKRHELIRIAVRSTPTAPGEQVAECVATVKRDDVKIRVMVGKVCFHSMPPSDVNAPISNPLSSLPSAMDSIQKEFF